MNNVSCVAESFLGLYRFSLTLTYLAHSLIFFLKSYSMRFSSPTYSFLFLGKIFLPNVTFESFLHINAWLTSSLALSLLHYEKKKWNFSHFDDLFCRLSRVMQICAAVYLYSVNSMEAHHDIDMH